ncbi:MAG: archease [Acidobacteria bacterium]|nr:archease [Acidobacteriota bacterium]
MATAGGARARGRPGSERNYWEHFAHGADVGVRGVGRTLADAFAQAAVALTAVVCDPAAVRSRQVSEIVCRAPALDLLFVDWLNALVYAMATEHLLFGEFEVRVEGTEVHALVRGEPVDPLRHEPAVEVKGATHTALEVAQQADGRWIAQCVVDV